MIVPRRPTAGVEIRRYAPDGREGSGGDAAGEGASPGPREDVVAVEEPLEVRILRRTADGEASLPVAVTMRTPGDDFELAAGFLFTEGILSDRREVAEITYCQDEEQAYNVVSVLLRPGVPLDPAALTRNFYTSSSCGVCGKASLDAVEVRGCAVLPRGGLTVARDVVASLPDRLRDAQAVFARTGGLHAAGLFDPAGELVSVREDVGRHNAVDKVVGEAFLEGRLPLADRVLAVSGRTSFEILQKAVVAGIPMVVAVGAPSSLAVDLARRFGATLVGFARGGSFNVYAGDERIG